MMDEIRPVTQNHLSDKCVKRTQARPNHLLLLWAEHGVNIGSAWHSRLLLLNSDDKHRNNASS
jgi:hypothetical protein